MSAVRIYIATVATVSLASTLVFALDDIAANSTHLARPDQLRSELQILLNSDYTEGILKDIN